MEIALYQEDKGFLFHVTCVMHNTRISQRMMDYKIKIDEPEFLEPEEEEKLIEILCEIIKEDKLKVLAINLCADHLHFVISCRPELLSAIAGKLKSKSARVFNIWRGITTPDEESARGHDPLSKRETQNNLWAQKFNRKLIRSEKQFWNVIQYIENNRLKHQLPELPERTIEMIQSVLTDYKNAFK
jgi:REP element-mobilizing transposase RayT